MSLKLQLVKNGRILFEMPLSPTDWQKDKLMNEFRDLEDNFQRSLSIFDALSHKTRFQMMRLLLEEEDRTMNFGDFMHDLDLNPKLVWENARKLRDSGFIKKISRGRYRCPELGQKTFMLMSLALSHMMEVLEEMETL